MAHVQRCRNTGRSWRCQSRVGCISSIESTLVNNNAAKRGTRQGCFRVQSFMIVGNSDVSSYAHFVHISKEGLTGRVCTAMEHNFAGRCLNFGRQVGYLHKRLTDLEKREVDSEAKVPSDVSLRCGQDIFGARRPLTVLAVLAFYVVPRQCLHGAAQLRMSCMAAFDVCRLLSKAGLLRGRRDETACLPAFLFI